MTAPPYLPPPALRLRLDLEELAGNWHELDRLSGDARAGAAVKADAYGLGAAQIVPRLRDEGCSDFFIAHMSEAAALLPLIPAKSISVLHGPLNDADVAYARATGVKPALNGLTQIARWLESGGGLCDLMVDTGINRLGLPMADLGDPRISELELDICMSHLASADEDVPLNSTQLTRFAEVRSRVKARRYSLANSAGIALGPDYHFDLTRPGLSLYGGHPRPGQRQAVTQVVFPEVAVLQTRELQAGDSVGYNATFTAPHSMRVGVVALGYADGYLRCWSGKGEFLWRNSWLPAVGRVSMDMTVVDLTAAPDVREGDWLTVAYDPAWAAAKTGLSQYELFTLLGKRFGRG